MSLSILGAKTDAMKYFDTVRIQMKIISQTEILNSVVLLLQNLSLNPSQSPEFLVAHYIFLFLPGAFLRPADSKKTMYALLAA